MCNAGSVADDVESLALCLKVLVKFYFHIVELDLYAVEQRVVVCCSRCDLVKGVNHLDDIVHDALGDHQGKVSRGSGQRRSYKAFLESALVGPASFDHVSEALYDDSAAQHVTEACDALSVLIGFLERLCEVLGHQKREVGVFGVKRRILVTVSVNGDYAVGVLIYHDSVRIHAEGPYQVVILLSPEDDLRFIEFISKM